MPRRKTLLLGNGINLMGGAGTSWEDVLRATSQFVGNPDIMSGWDLKSLPLLYEELYSEHVGRKKLKEFDLKQFVADEVAKVAGNDFHLRVIQSGVRNVLTTNYDLALEESGKDKWSKENLQRETKYSRFRRNKVDDTFIWHIHGACDAPNTIQLGHEHYSGQLQYLRDLVVGFTKRPLDKIKSAFLQGNIDFDDIGVHHAWLDVFFRDDVHIVGLGMDFSEIDIWWAIAYKNRLNNGETRARKSKQGITLRLGSTTYHTLSKTAENSREKAKQDILRSLGVKIKSHSNQGSYRGMYEQVISLISAKSL